MGEKRKIDCKPFKDGAGWVCKAIKDDKVEAMAEYKRGTGGTIVKGQFTGDTAALDELDAYIQNKGVIRAKASKNFSGFDTEEI